jgi:hypothetical protein
LLVIAPVEQDSLIFPAALTLHRAMLRSIQPLSIGVRKLTEHVRCEKSLLRRSSRAIRENRAKSKESQMTHNLNNPHEWLLKKAQHWNAEALYKALRGLAYRLDGKSISDVFHSEMQGDGYFDEKLRTNADAFDAESWGSHRWHT